jgi:hypothetical protein
MVTVVAQGATALRRRTHSDPLRADEGRDVRAGSARLGETPGALLVRADAYLGRSVCRISPVALPANAGRNPIRTADRAPLSNAAMTQPRCREQAEQCSTALSPISPSMRMAFLRVGQPGDVLPRLGPQRTLSATLRASIAAVGSRFLGVRQGAELELAHADVLEARELHVRVEERGRERLATGSRSRTASAAPSRQNRQSIR